MSFHILRDIFSGRYGADSCVRAVLFLKSPANVKNYLTIIHKLTFPSGDKGKDERWHTYPRVSDVIPIREKDLSDSNFMSKQADKLSLDISRSLEYLTDYTKVDNGNKPVMLHYGIIYLFDFFSRTWLKYKRNWSHGIKLVRDENDYCVRILKAGIFARAVDAFYLTYQSNLFSLDNDFGLGQYVAEELKLEKMKYAECPRICLTRLIDMYDQFKISARARFKNMRTQHEFTLLSNPILVGYVILFIMSSISRYRAKDWTKIREDRDLKNKFDDLQYEFLYEWIPEIFMQTILKAKKELPIG